MTLARFALELLRELLPLFKPSPKTPADARSAVAGYAAGRSAHEAAANAGRLPLPPRLPARPLGPPTPTQK